MIRIETVQATVGEIVSVAIIVDEPVPVHGVQLEVHFDQDVVEYVSVSSPPNALAVDNLREPGLLEYTAVSVPDPLPQIIAVLEFLVHGTSVLALADVLVSAADGTPIPVELQHGAINTIGIPAMDVLFQWSNPNPGIIGVTEAVLEQSFDGVSFAPLVTVPAPDNQTTQVIDQGQGVLSYRVVLRNDVGDAPPSNVVTLNTDLPAPAEGLVVQIV